MRKFPFLLTLSAILFLPLSSFADITLVDGDWTTTYDCLEWDQVIDGPSGLSCDGIGPGGDWTCNGKGEQITTGANHPYGGAARGQRHWMGNGVDLTEVAPQSGSLSFVFDFPPSELWVRYYARYEKGFPQAGQGFHKVMYAFHSEVEGLLFYIDTGSGGNVFRMVRADIGEEQAITHYGFDDIYGELSDGSWHSYEYHFDPSNGIFEMWVDDVWKISASVVYAADQIRLIVLPEGHKTVSLERDMYYDVDDVAFSTNGRVGSLRPPWDFNKDGDVDGYDLSLLISEYNRTDCSDELPCTADINQDNRVDETDILLFSSPFGKTDFSE